MSFNMAAILRINATVTGTGDVQRLNAELGQTGPTAQRSAAGVNALGRAMADVGKVAAGIGLANLTSRLGGFTSSAITAGDETLRLEARIKAMSVSTQEAARVQEFAGIYAKRFTLSQLEAGDAVSKAAARLRPLGLSLKEIESMMIGVSNAGRVMGMTSRDTAEVMRQLSQGIGAGAVAGDELRAILERMPPLAAAFAKAMNDVAKDKGLQLITKQQAATMLKQIQQDEVNQTRALKEGLERRNKEVETAANTKLKLIRNKYSEELEALGDALDEQERLRRDKAEEALDASLKRLGRQFREERTAIRRERQDQDEEIRQSFEDLGGGYYRYEFGQNVFTIITEAEKKAIERAIEDRRQEEDDALDDREEAERKSIQKRVDEEQRQRDLAAREERQKREQQITDRQDMEETAVKDALEKQKAALERAMQEQIDRHKAANQEMIKDIKERTEVEIADIKRLASEGRITPEVAKRVGPILENLKVPPATPLDRFGASMGDLSQTIGKRLIPALEKLVSMFERFEDFIDKLPGWAKDLGIVAAGVGGLGLAWRGLSGVGGFLRGGPRGGPPAAPPAPPAPPVAPGARLPTGVPGAPSGVPGWARYSRMPSIAPPGAPAPPTPPPGMIQRIGDVARAAGGGIAQAGKALAEFAAGAPAALGRIGAAFANLRIAATIAGWVGSVGALGSGIVTALQGAIAWIGGTAVPALAAFFSGPAGWVTLAGAALVTGAIVWRKPIGEFMDHVAAENDKLAAKIEPALTKVGDKITETINGSADKFKNMVAFESKAMDEFFAKIYEDFGKTIENKIEQIKKKGLGETLRNDLGFESKALDIFFTNIYEEFGKGIEKKITDLATGIGNAFSGGAKAIKTELNYILAICEDAINRFASAANDRIASVNRASSRIGIPPIPMVPNISIPRLARGGWTDRATTVVIGEGGDPGGEYAIPAARMPAAMEAWQRGMRGAELVRAMQSPGLAPGRAMTAPSSAPAGPVNVTIKTGPVIRQSDGSQWVRIDEVPAIVQAAVAASRRAR